MKSESSPARNSEVSEKAIEAYLGQLTREAGGLSLKYSNGNTTGYPDRLLLFPGGVAAWVEVKSRGKHPTRLQAVRIDQLRRLGFRAWVCDSREKAEAIITEMTKKR